MKTPREILLKKHEAAGPKLDAIRHEVVSRHCAAVESEGKRSSTGILVRLWMELFRPCRHIWSGLAAVWVLLLLINCLQRDATPASLAKGTSPAGPMMTFDNQERLLNDLLAERTQPGEAVRPSKFEPKPRSETSGTEIL